IIIAFLMFASRFICAAQFTSDSSLTAYLTPTHLLERKLPSFKISNAESSISHEIFSNKVILLTFWFVGCTACMAEIPYLNTLIDSINDRQFQIISFARNTKDEIEMYLSNTNDSFKKPKYSIIPLCDAPYV